MSKKYPILEDYFYKMTSRKRNGCDMIKEDLNLDKILKRNSITGLHGVGFGQLLFDMNKKITESCEKLLQENK
jgi:hypothetical protein